MGHEAGVKIGGGVRARIGGELDVILLDPPRSGCSPELLRKVRKCTTARIVYISCGPDTLARDLHLMKELGYELSGAKTVDLFPRTGHVETVCLLTRNGENSQKTQK